MGLCTSRFCSSVRTNRYITTAATHAPARNPRSIVVRAWNIGRVSLNDPRVQMPLFEWTDARPAPSPSPSPSPLSQLRPNVDVFVLSEIREKDARALAQHPPPHFTCIAAPRAAYGFTMCVGVQSDLLHNVTWPHHRLAVIKLFRDCAQVDLDGVDGTNATFTSASTRPAWTVIGMHAYRSAGMGVRVMKQSRVNDAEVLMRQHVRAAWFRALHTAIAEAQPGPLVVTGDYNYDFERSPFCALSCDILRAPHELTRVPLGQPTYENHKTNVVVWRGGAFRPPLQQSHVCGLGIGRSRSRCAPIAEGDESKDGDEEYDGADTATAISTTTTSKQAMPTPTPTRVDWRVEPVRLALDHIFVTSKTVAVNATVVGSQPCHFDLGHRYIGAHFTAL